MLGHSGDTTDADHLAELADAGFVLGMDRFGINLDTTFEARGRHWSSRCAAAATPSRWCSPRTRPATSTGWRPACWTCAAVALPPHQQDVLPYLREHGVTEEQIETMLVTNPARILAG